MGRGLRSRPAGQADLLPVAYYNVEFTLPAPVAAIAFGNKAVVYGLLFRTAADTPLTIAADPEDLGAWIGLTAVLHPWGSTMTTTRTPTSSCRAATCRPTAHARPGFLPLVRVLSRLFHRLFLNRLAEVHGAGRLAFHGDLAALADPAAFAAHLAPLREPNGSSTPNVPSPGRKPCWPTCRASPTASPSATAGSWRSTSTGFTFRWKDYRTRGKGVPWQKTMTLAIDEFIRRFVLHVLPDGPTAYVTMACSPAAAHAPLMLSESGACSRSPRRRTSRQPRPRPPTRPAPRCARRLIILERSRPRQARSPSDRAGS